MQFPPLDDVRWDRLMEVVLERAPAGPRSNLPLGPQSLTTPLPTTPASGATTQRDSYA